jgi:hypothetical protein
VGLARDASDPMPNIFADTVRRCTARTRRSTFPSLCRSPEAPGDLLLAHYLLGHNIGGNYESERIRCTLYFRLSSVDHASHREEFLQDVWLEYEAIP